MLVDGFNDLHGFRASVPDDGEFDGVMGFAVPVLHVSVKERGAALLTLLSQFRQSNVEEVDVGQPPWFAIGSSEIVVPCVRVGSLDRFGKHGDVARGASDVGKDEARPLSSMSILNLGGMGGLRVAGVVAGNMASISSFVIGVAGPSAGVSFRDALLTRPISFLTMNAPAPPMIVNIAQIAMTQFGSPMSMF